VYSLGAVLFELLTGRLPATPENAQKLSPVAYRAWLDCKRAKIGVPADVEVDSRLMAVVLKCLAFEAAARFASAEELAAELRRFLERAARPRVMRKVRRRAAIAAGVALVVGGGGAWAYVASRPMTAERLYERGLAEYQRGEYSQAIETFTQCLERRPGWTEALFGRGQALLRLEKWSEARTDFMALRRVNSAWANAFVGYCSLRTGESNLASANFFSAYRDGLRDVAFLLDYAKAETMQQHHSEAAKRYSEVIEREPTNVEAIRNRAMTLFMVVVNDKEKIPTQQAFDDIEKYCRLSPDSFEAPYCGAVVYGEAAKKNSAFENKAIRYLTEALQKGMPLEAVGFYKLQVKRLLPFVSAQVLIDARRDSTYRLDLRPPHEPPSIADWRAFQKQYGLARELLVRNK
jgi:tetratricopeptide (TPR) repeat protein